MTTTSTGGISWAVMRGGKLATLHRELGAAERAARRDGLVLSVEARCPTMRPGDEARDFAGQILPR